MNFIFSVNLHKTDITRYQWRNTSVSLAKPNAPQQHIFGIADLNASHNGYINYINSVCGTANDLIYTTFRELVLILSFVVILHQLLAGSLYDG
jgi:hypothetical protein